MLLQTDLGIHWLQTDDSRFMPGPNGVKPLSPEQEELIHRLVYFQNEYEQPSEDDLKRIEVHFVLSYTPHKFGDSISSEKCYSRFKPLMNISLQFIIISVFLSKLNTNVKLI